MALLAAETSRIQVGELDLEVVDIDAEFVYLHVIPHHIECGFAVLCTQEEGRYVERVVHLPDGIRELQVRYELMDYVA